MEIKFVSLKLTSDGVNANLSVDPEDKKDLLSDDDDTLDCDDGETSVTEKPSIAKAVWGDNKNRMDVN